MRRLAVLSSSLAVAAFAAGLPGQTRDDGGLWLMWLGQGRFAPRDEPLGALRWWLDVQPRWLGDGDRYDTTLLRPGLGWALDERVTAWAGYAWIQVDPVGVAPFDENRVWQQVTWNVPVEGFTLLSRTRLEQRFIEGSGDTGWRFRQFVKATLPLSPDGDVFASAYDEIFHDIDDTAWGQRQGLRQNRAFAGLGWRFDPERNWSLEVGYLNQWLDRPGEDAMNHILSINVFMNF
jgi:hypothetical protein